MTMKEPSATNTLTSESASTQTMPIPKVTVVPSDSLFHGQREVWIEHDGERYRLRITRRGKLILQK
jgi:hemin uptake protein HemP